MEHEVNSSSTKTGPAPSRRAAKSLEPTRDRILKAAARILSSRGYSATTLRAIASELGIKAGSIYYHFSSKDEIIDEVMDIGLRAVQAAVECAVGALGAQATPRERIEMAIRAHLKAILLNADFTSANVRVHSQLPRELRRKHDQYRTEYGEFWNGLLWDAQSTGGLRQDLGIVPIRQFLFGAMNWNVEWFDPERYSVDALADRCVLLLFEGMWSKDAPAVARPMINDSGAPEHHDPAAPGPDRRAKRKRTCRRQAAPD